MTGLCIILLMTAHDVMCFAVPDCFTFQYVRYFLCFLPVTLTKSMSPSPSLLQNEYSPHKIETIVSVVVASTACTLSILGSALIIGTYISYLEIRKPARSLLFYLSITDLGTALSYAMTFIVCGGSCDCTEGAKELYSLLGIYFPVSSFLWTDCIALYIYAGMTRTNCNYILLSFLFIYISFYAY